VAGGVAEMLASLLAYIRGAGLDARWLVIGGDPAFLRVTKRIHNMLRGSPGDGQGLGPADAEVYRETAALFRGHLEHGRPPEPAHQDSFHPS
jgi:trehalose synthase